MNALRKTESANDPLSSVNPTVVKLSKLSFIRGLRPLAFDWATITLMMTLATFFPSTLVTMVAVIVIASRQHALLVIVHEGAHFRLAKNHRWNDFLANTFAAFPIFFCTHAYRLNHLKHHRHLNTLQDPDWARKVDLPEWTFPQSRRQLLGTFLKILTTGWLKMILLFIHFSGVLSKNTFHDKEKRRLLATKLFFYGLSGATLTYLNLGSEFLIFWLLPFLVVLPVIERVRSISEHFALSYKDDFNQTRDILCTPLEAFLFGPHNIRYHLTHHLYPSVPQYHLPELHECLMTEPGFAHSAHQNDSYFLFGTKSLLMDLTAKKEEFP